MQAETRQDLEQTQRAAPPWWVYLYYGLLLASLFLFAVIAENVYRVRGFAFDSAILTWFNSLQAPGLTRFALALDSIGISYFLGFAALIMALFLWRHHRRSSFFITFGFWGAVLVNIIVKELFERVRPDLFEQLTPITNSSFPSGHAMGSWAFFLVCLLVTRKLAAPETWVAWLFGGVFAVSVGLSRLYLQVHYPSDVLAGWALSSAWVLGLGHWYRRREHRKVSASVTPGEAALSEALLSEALLDEDVRQHFPTVEAANAALRGLVRLFPNKDR